MQARLTKFAINSFFFFTPANRLQTTTTLQLKNAQNAQNSSESDKSKNRSRNHYLSFEHSDFKSSLLKQMSGVKARDSSTKHKHAFVLELVHSCKNERGR